MEPSFASEPAGPPGSLFEPGADAGASELLHSPLHGQGGNASSPLEGVRITVGHGPHVKRARQLDLDLALGIGQEEGDGGPSAPPAPDAAARAPPSAPASLVTPPPPPAKPKRGNYRCSKCGQLKKGHICTAVGSGTQDTKGKKEAAIEAAMAARGALRVAGSGVAEAPGDGPDAGGTPQRQRRKQASGRAGRSAGVSPRTPAKATPPSHDVRSARRALLVSPHASPGPSPGKGFKCTLGGLGALSSLGSFSRPDDAVAVAAANGGGGEKGRKAGPRVTFSSDEKEGRQRR